MNHVTVRIFDVSCGRVESRFLDMCATKGTDSATAPAIFNKIDQVLHFNGIPWINCVGFGVDNTSVNVGVTRVKQQNADCHLVHNVACRASGSFSDFSGFDVEDMSIDIFYYFDKSTKRKSTLVEFADFCDVKYRQVIKHVNTRWLSLEIAVKRNFQIYPALKSYFLSNSESVSRFKRLKDLFNDPMTEIYLLFYNAVLPTFTVVNRFLQREYPCIYAIYHQLHRFLMGKFITIQHLKAAGIDLMSVKYSETNNQLKDDQLFIVFLTKQKVQKLLNDGDISPRKVTEFYSAVRQFYMKATQECLAKLPLNDDLLLHAQFVAFFQKDDSGFDDIEFFVKKFPHHLPSTVNEIEKLQEEFVEYQMLEKNQIPGRIWESARVKHTEDDNGQELDESSSYFRMDVIWDNLSSLQLVDGSSRFGRLSKVAKLILILPHSNPGEERVFSMVRKNKNAFRGSLGVEGTLSSLMTIKQANCHHFEPPTEVLTSAKKATREYNLLHKKK